MKKQTVVKIVIVVVVVIGLGLAMHLGGGAISGMLQAHMMR